MGRIRIAAVGDVMCGETFYQYRRGPRTHMDELGVQFLDDEVVSFLKSHDFVLGNVECALSDLGWLKGSLRSHQLRGRPETADYLRDWGFTCANLANNHILEHGQPAAEDTASRLRCAGLGVIGAGRDQQFEPGIEVFEADVGSLKVGAIGGCLLSQKYAFGGGGSLAQMLDATHDLSQRCDVVIVSQHWGTEYMDYPSAEQKVVAASFATAGATLVLGHHPHVVQGVERRNGALVAYSLGNFIFDQLPPDTRWSMILSCEVDERSVVSWECVPVALDDRHRPRFPKAHTRDGLLEEVDRRHRLVDRKHFAEARTYRREATRRDRQSRRQRWARILRSLPTLPPAYTAQMVARPVLRRLEAW